MRNLKLLLFELLKVFASSNVARTSISLNWHISTTLAFQAARPVIYNLPRF